MPLLVCDKNSCTLFKNALITPAIMGLVSLYTITNKEEFYVSKRNRHQVNMFSNYIAWSNNTLKYSAKGPKT